ncbi:purine-nucleoside phosphorylase [Clostridium sp. NSJ-6]|uniref:Purine nucleoside phosphorylase n=1 Tax=Clostridium hominis TaxID=2763036 RepID=A0ABR7DGI5_9CLOT|nr:purine-nucleoside phosphorylase [Clostridium hominis]MBC5629943.1 purine-nucleoside phosphorylase [Clostridium hominis]
MDLLNQIKASADFILSKSNYKPEIGLILGSGLGSLADSIENPEFYNYSDIPNFPTSTVEGHAGRLVIGTLGGKQVVAMQGRFHYYEGYSMEKITFPVRVMKLLGVSKLIVTNACGAVNQDFNAGDLMVITDHINFSGSNPLFGHNLDEFGPRFPDMSEAYNLDLRNKVLNVGKELGLDLKQGVYVMFSGPTYETPAEVRMAKIMGGDAVGMSTVPEVIVANHSGIKTVGISCLTNMAAGILDQPLNHEEVIETSARVKNDFIKLMNRVIEII